MVEIELLPCQVPVRGEEQVHIRPPLPGARPGGQGAAVPFTRFVLRISWAGPPRRSAVSPGNWLHHRDGWR
jgi:hypothetical protein